MLKRQTHPESWPPVEFDNSYPWLNHTWSELFANSRCWGKPMYIWGVLQGAALARVLGISRISVIEFGVAGGHGLITLEAIAESVEQRTDVAIDVFGFDTGVGLPKPVDYRDQPNKWFEGQLPMDKERLQAKLRRAKLYLGPVAETVPAWLAEHHEPVGFVSHDLDLYTSTQHALQLFGADYDRVLPRVITYFDDIFGHTYNDDCGERLAIDEYNKANNDRKLRPIYGLRYFAPRICRDELWPDGMYWAHFFEHPMYNAQDKICMNVAMDIEGKVIWRRPDANWRREAGLDR